MPTLYPVAEVLPCWGNHAVHRIWPPAASPSLLVPLQPAEHVRRSNMTITMAHVVENERIESNLRVLVATARPHDASHHQTSPSLLISRPHAPAAFRADSQPIHPAHTPARPPAHPNLGRQLSPRCPRASRNRLFIGVRQSSRSLLVHVVASARSKIDCLACMAFMAASSPTPLRLVVWNLLGGGRRWLGLVLGRMRMTHGQRLVAATWESRG